MELIGPIIAKLGLDQLFIRYDIEQLLSMMVIAPLLVGLIVAALDLSFLNNPIEILSTYIINKHANCGLGIKNLLFGSIAFPSKIFTSVSHAGWKYGLILWWTFYPFILFCFIIILIFLSGYQLLDEKIRIAESFGERLGIFIGTAILIWIIYTLVDFVLKILDSIFGK